ncbi:MAG: sulfurtransferase complex subunit TusB [Gammaproteobacteria bacterium]
MSILHIVNKTPYDRNSLATAVSMMKDDDTLLLIEDAVVGAIKAGKAAAILSGHKVTILGPDLAARGVSEDKLVDGVTIVDYAGFVDLVEANDKAQSWL